MDFRTLVFYFNDLNHLMPIANQVLILSLVIILMVWEERGWINV